MAGDARYERFGWDYAAINPLEDRAVAWYRAHARESGGPVLELACGTGRLVAALAADGYEVVGLDRSAAMLDQASAGVGTRARFVRGDMRAFALDRRFGLVLVADNSLRELETEEDILACLACVRRHLRADGRLLVTERRFDPGRYPGGVLAHDWAPVGTDPRTGRPTERRVRVHLDADHRRLHGVMTYREVGSEEETALAFESLVLRPEDYRRLFEAAGFATTLHVGYTRRPDDGVDPILCFVASPEGYAAAGGARPLP